MRIHRSTLPYLHPHIALQDLHANLKLFTEAEISAIKASLPAKGKYREMANADGKMMRLKYAVLVQNGRYFGVYKGLKSEGLAAKEEHNWQSILGKGHFGVVKLAQDLETEEWVALKVQGATNKEGPGFNFRAELINLFRVGQTVNSDVTGKPIALVRHSESRGEDRHYMPVKLAHGHDLFDLAADDNARLPCVKWINIVLSMLRETKKLHQLGILHRDLKLDNIHCERASGNTRIVDFGLAVEMGQDGKMVSDLQSGTPGYIAPEIMDDEVITYSEQTEVFALGVTIGKMLGFIGDVLFTDNIFFISDQETNYAELSSKISDPAICEKIDSYLRKMCREIPEYKRDTERRPTIDEAIEFFTGVKNNLSPEDKSIKVGLLSVKDYLQVMTDGAETEKKNLSSYLKTVDEVWLLDQKKEDALYYEKVRRLLTQKNVIVGYQLFHGAPISDLMAGIPAYVARHGQVDCYSYSTIRLGRAVALQAPDQQKAIKRTHADSQEVAAPDQRIELVNEKNFSELKTKLDFEIIRLKRKYKGNDPVVKKRIKAIEAVIAELKADGGSTTYVDLKHELGVLESKMQSTNALARKLGIFGTVTGFSKLRELREWVEAKKPGM